MTAPSAPSDEPVYRLAQSPSIHLLAVALGCSVGLLLAALRLPVLAGLMVAASGAYGLARLRLRATVTMTRRRLVVSRGLREEAILLVDVRSARVEKDLWSRDLVVEARDGRTLRVRDVQDPAGAVAVLLSLARAASEAREPGPPLPTPRAFDAGASEDRLARKARVKAFDLGFLDQARR